MAPRWGYLKLLPGVVKVTFVLKHLLNTRLSITNSPSGVSKNFSRFVQGTFLER
jgi:hypothetical protein